MNQSAARARIEALRSHLASTGVQALLVPSADPHLSEYLPGRLQGRQWLSGFTGSQATLVVAASKAALFRAGVKSDRRRPVRNFRFPVTPWAG